MEENNQLKILQLEELRKFCKKLLELQKERESNKDLLTFLDKNYELEGEGEDIKKIIEIIKGKKKINPENKKEIDDIKLKVSSYCNVTDIKEADPIDYTKLIKKVTIKISKLKKDEQELSNKEPNKVFEEKATESIALVKES